MARILFAFDAHGDRRAELPLALVAPAGLLAMAGALHVGDNTRRRLVRLDATDGHALGEARGFEGPVAALAATGDALWLHPGGASLPVRLERRGAAVRQGVSWGGPIALGGEPHAWQRLSALGDASGGRVVFFVHADDGVGPPAPDPSRLDEPTGGFDPPAWRAIGEGAPDVWVRETSERLWIGVLLSGDGQRTPFVEQLRLSFDDEGYAQHLPAIYRVPSKVSAGAPPVSRETLERFLALFEGFFDDTEGAIAGLARLFDPASVPESWLGWLAGWLAFPLEEGWPSAKKRRLLADAFEAYAWRGTSRGLARALADRLGIVASVEEPHAQMDWWVLPVGDGGGACAAGSAAASRSRLGLTTRLAPAAAQGAVVGSTAILDRSHLIEEEDVGEPLFTPTAYQFSVVLPRSQASAPATLERIRELIEREKPAHTAYEICLVDPGIRIGHQALLGIDTVLGGTSPATATPLGEPAASGLVLGRRARRPDRQRPARRVDPARRRRRRGPRAKGSTGAHRPMREEKPWAQ